ncbi:hypothetical protein F5Y18DRAFT_421661 [Xylariaceae sp. FL1019]|nr:hypothetical protein F5Y18DRAFT_421661 [Xylariaceae sp. FL1019]
MVVSNEIGFGLLQAALGPARLLPVGGCIHRGQFRNIIDVAETRHRRPKGGSLTPNGSYSNRTAKRHARWIPIGPWPDI